MNESARVFEIFSDRIEITSMGGLSIIKNSDEFFNGTQSQQAENL